MKNNRKTIPAKTLVEITNNMLAAPLPSRAERLTACAILEAALITSNAYHGFRYLRPDELEADVLPGIIEEKLADGWTRQAFPDDSRRAYYHA